VHVAESADRDHGEGTFLWQPSQRWGCSTGQAKLHYGRLPLRACQSSMKQPRNEKVSQAPTLVRCLLRVDASDRFPKPRVAEPQRSSTGTRAQPPTGATSRSASTSGSSVIVAVPPNNARTATLNVRLGGLQRPDRIAANPGRIHSTEQ